jgi:hypothetical protein
MAQVCPEECAQKMDVVVRKWSKLRVKFCLALVHQRQASKVTDDLWMRLEADMCVKDSLEVADHQEPLSVSETPIYRQSGHFSVS